MKILDLLAKLGILRWGSTAATYKTGAERPTDLMMDGVLNAKRDLTSQKGGAKPGADEQGKRGKTG